MEEETKEEEKEKTKQVENVGKESPEPKGTESAIPEKPDMIARANFAAERLEKANAEASKNLDRKEKLMAEQRLGGFTEAGQPPKKEEISDKEYARKAQRGELNKE